MTNIYIPVHVWGTCGKVPCSGLEAQVGIVYRAGLEHTTPTLADQYRSLTTVMFSPESFFGDCQYLFDILGPLLLSCSFERCNVMYFLCDGFYVWKMVIHWLPSHCFFIFKYKSIILPLGGLFCMPLTRNREQLHVYFVQCIVRLALCIGLVKDTLFLPYRCKQKNHKNKNCIL